MFLYGACDSDEVFVPKVAPASCEPGTVKALRADGRFPGFAANASVHEPVNVVAECHHTPRKVAAQTRVRSLLKRRRPIVVDSSSLPPTRVQLVFEVGLVST